MPQGDKAGFSVFWNEFGTGPHPALLLHCALAHSKVWARLAHYLEDDLLMIAPDMLGHGKSAAPDLTGSLNDQIFAVSSAFLTDPAHLIGHSFGATVALRIAIEFPERVRSLTLIEPVLFAAAKESDSNALHTYLAEELPFSEAMSAEDLQAAAQAFTRIWSDARAWSHMSDQERSQMANLMPFIQATQSPLFDDTAGLLAPGRLEAIQCPVLLVRGSETNAIIPAIHTALARRIAHAECRVVAQAEHMVPITHPQAVAEHIKPMLHAI